MATLDVTVVLSMSNFLLQTVRGISVSATVRDLKERIAALDSFPSPEYQLLINKGLPLIDDTAKLEDVDLDDISVLMVVDRGEQQRRIAAAAPAEPQVNIHVPEPVIEAKVPDFEPNNNTDNNNASPRGPAVEARPDDNAHPFAPVADVAPVNTNTAPAVANNTAPAVANVAPANPTAAPANNANPVADANATLAIQIATLSGPAQFVDVPLHASFGHIKTTILEPLLKIPAMNIKLIYIGHPLDDHTSPFQVGSNHSCSLLRRPCVDPFCASQAQCMDNTMIHMVRTHDDSILNQVISERDLCGNCRFCHGRGVRFKFRPQCGACGNESVIEVPDV